MSDKKNKYNTVKKAIEAFIQLLGEYESYKLSNIEDVEEYNCNIYNEISLQHELGLFLREYLEGTWKIFFEKSMYSNQNKKNDKKENTKENSLWIKKEVDLVAIKYENGKISGKYAIELKFSKGINARTPENMFDFIKDIHFMEQVKKYKDFTKTYNLIIVDSPKYYDKYYYEKKNRPYIYYIFKAESDGKIEIPKIPDNDKKKYIHPTGNSESKEFILEKEYKNICWKPIGNLKKLENYRYLFIEVD